MQAIISPGKIQGSITPPPSKSMMQRACAAALLHKGKTTIIDPGTSDDDKAALHIIQQLGAVVTHHSNYIEVVSSGIRPVSNIIDCGESGLSARLFIPIAAMHDSEVTITGHGSLLQRPMLFFVDILPELGVGITANNRLPITVKGPLKPRDIHIDGSLSSQYLSGLLFAYAFGGHNETLTITVDNLNSRPYTDMTIDVLQQFGADVWHENYTSFRSKSINEIKNEITITIEKDWSAAANWLVAAAINNEIAVEGLNYDSLQADKAITAILKSKDAFDIDVTHCPDLVPILAIYAAQCKSTSNIKGIHRLIHKESNRIRSVSAMLSAFGVSFAVKDDVMSIKGDATFRSCTIDAHNDHRIVMAATIAALQAAGPVTITGAEAVSKSYPGFFSHLSSLSAKCILKDE